MVEHVDIADGERHEPKGIAAAAANTVYRANGAGSGTWGLIPTASIDLTALYAAIEAAIDGATIAIKRQFVATAVIPDVSTPKIIYMAVPDSCTILGAHMVLGASITVADAVVSFKDASGASLGATVTITQAGSLPGDEFSFAATTNVDLTGPTYIQIETDGGSTTAAELYITVAFEVPI